MDYFKQPVVERRDNDDVTVWRLVGDWTRDLPLDVRRAAADALKGEATRLVLDLGDVSFLDSWGEETVCAALQRVREGGGVVAWRRDAARPSEYAGMARALERRQLHIPGFTDLAAAIAAVKQP
jgi:anti-anti-sigma regulatory factor